MKLDEIRKTWELVRQEIDKKGSTWNIFKCVPGLVNVAEAASDHVKCADSGSISSAQEFYQAHNRMKKALAELEAL